MSSLIMRSQRGSSGTPPTFVSYTQTAWTGGGGVSGTLTTASISVQSGDVLVVVASSEDSPRTIATPTGGSLTYTLQQSNVVSSNCTAYLWTAVASSTTSFTVAATCNSNSHYFGLGVYVFRSATVGASNKATGSGGPSLSLTTTKANSAIVVLNSDWNAGDGTTRTWRTAGDTPTAGNGQEKNYYRSAANYTTYNAYHADSGAAGAKTVGLSAPTGQAYSIVACEIKGP